MLRAKQMGLKIEITETEQEAFGGLPELAREWFE